MSRLRLNRSATRALLLFWLFQSLPRCWYFASSDLPESAGPLAHVALPLLLGFLRDGLLVAALLLPIQVLHLLGARRRIPSGLTERLGAILTFGLSLLLVCALADVEFMRYLGFHASLTHLALVVDWEKLRSSLSHELTPLAFPSLLLAAGFILSSALVRLDGVLRFLRTGRGALASAAVLALGTAAAWVPVPGPVTANAAENFFVSVVEGALRSDDLGGGGGRPIAALLEAAPLPHPGVATPEWRYFDPDFPLVKATDHHLCRLGLLGDGDCARDADGDGHSLRADCNDREPGIHPDARDVPRNGIDEDCSGIDADPPNVIFVHWEGVRAVNVGSIGYAAPSTPRFDALARDGQLFSNAYANGAQTRWSLISVYCSTLPRLSNEWIFKHNHGLELLCFPEILKRRGYQTIYVHGGNIGFAGKRRRLGPWFQMRFDRTNAPIRDMQKFNWGARDRDVARFTYEMLKARRSQAPFFLVLATLAVHHPFDLPEPRFEAEPHTDRRNQLSNVIRYTDAAAGEFLERVLADPEFENTIVLIASDHGINWFSPHPEGRQSVLWEDLVWVPMALLGEAWKLEKGIVAEVRQLADIGPTILDRLGIEVPNPFIGNSLLRRFRDREPRAFFATANGGRSAGVRIGRYKFFEHFDTGGRYLFDLDSDREETANLADEPSHSSRVAELETLVRDVYRANERLIAENRIWTRRYRLDGGVPR
jgi:arylsulfatase A-like enzyme